MRQIVVLLLVLALSGCLGHGSDAAGRGDIVAFVATGHTAHGDVPVIEGARIDLDDGWRVGNGSLGASFDRHLLGASPGDELTFTTSASAALELGNATSVATRLPDLPTRGEANLRDWPGAPPVPGDVVEHEAFDYPRRVEEVRVNTTQVTLTRVNETLLERQVTGSVVVRTLQGDGSVAEQEIPVGYSEQLPAGNIRLEPGNSTTQPPSTQGSIVYRRVIEGEHRVPSILHGGVVVATPGANAIERRVEPVPGLVFFASQDLDLQPGFYHVDGSSGDAGDTMEVRPVLAPRNDLTIFLAQPMTWQVRVLDVAEAPPGAGPLPGHEGTRLSPVLGG